MFARGGKNRRHTPAQCCGQIGTSVNGRVRDKSHANWNLERIFDQ
jgi:hypothetical protein